MRNPWPKPWSGHAGVHGAHLEHGVEQPVLSNVSKEVRNNTLPIFYGTNSFLFTIFDREIDSQSIFKWARTIGRANMSLLKEIKIVVWAKRNVKYVHNQLIPALKKLGLRSKEGG